MRVIAGKCRSLQLTAPPGLDVRPTTDRIKETLFNILNPYIPGCIFLDIFAGSGAIGIEALSRGAQKAYFIDNSAQSIECIKANLKHTRLEEDASVVRSDAVSAIMQFSRIGQKFDVIFLDPPYGKGLEKPVLEAIAKSDILADEGFIVVEELADTDFSYVESIGFSVSREKRYGSNKHVFIDPA